MRWGVFDIGTGLITLGIAFTIGEQNRGYRHRSDHIRNRIYNRGVSESSG